MCVWKQNLETLSVKPQLDPAVLPIQNGDPYTVPPMLLPYGHDRVSLLGGHPHTSVVSDDTPGEEEAALALITGDDTMHSYALVKTAFASFLSLFLH